jgi:hypothetical protein
VNRCRQAIIHGIESANGIVRLMISSPESPKATVEIGKWRT